MSSDTLQWESLGYRVYVSACDRFKIRRLSIPRPAAPRPRWYVWVDGIRDGTEYLLLRDAKARCERCLDKEGEAE